MVEMDELHMVWRLSDPPVAEQYRSDRIYTEFFNLKAIPFSITPDPEFLFLSDTHQSVLERLQYGLQNRMGCLLLTGEVGTGKTTLCRVLLDQLQGKTHTVYVINPSFSGHELIASILDDLGIARTAGASKKELIDQLNRFLLTHEATRQLVIVIDDAQTMPVATLEDLRLLSNLESDKNKLLQMLLVGQPELLARLESPEMRQLKQRVSLHCFLDYLMREEVRGYVERRLFIAGNQGQVRFSSKAIKHIHKQSAGIPRMINKICDFALTAAYASNSYGVDLPHVKTACSELFESPSKTTGRVMTNTRSRPLLRATALLAAGLVAGIGLTFAGRSYLDQAAAKPALKVSNPGGTQNSDSITGLLRSYDNQKRIQPAAVSMQKTGGYILQLGSFNTLATTLRAVAHYSTIGIQTHWNPIDLGDKGIWYRVFAGRYATTQEARQFQQGNALVSAKVLFAPWTVSLEPLEGGDDAGGLQAIIDSEQLDSYFATGENGRQHLCSGAFISRESAEALATRIYRQTGVAVGIANFSSPFEQLRIGGRMPTGGEPS